jgi:hypothetical protein
VVDPGGARCRIHFQRKQEFDFVEGVADRVAVHANHPVLADYDEPNDSLYISSATAEPVAVVGVLRDLCELHFGG